MEGAGDRVLGAVEETRDCVPIFGLYIREVGVLRDSMRGALHFCPVRFRCAVEFMLYIRQHNLT